MLPALLLALAQATSVPGTAAVDVPVRYIAGQVFAMPRTKDGHTLKLLVDTGGPGGSNGRYSLMDTTIQSLNLKTRKVGAGRHPWVIAEPPEYAPDASIRTGAW